MHEDEGCEGADALYIAAQVWSRHLSVQDPSILLVHSDLSACSVPEFGDPVLLLRALDQKRKCGKEENGGSRLPSLRRSMSSCWTTSNCTPALVTAAVVSVGEE